MIHVVGTNHKLTSVAGRERLAASEALGRELADRARAELGASESVLLGTCNRFEAYFVAPAPSFRPAAASDLLCASLSPERMLPAGGVYCHTGHRAAEHLFSVACGLDSMVLGEHEVLGQVKSALAQATAAKRTGPVLTRLFQHAVKTGRRARRETAISRGIFSLGQCAARVCEGILGDLRGQQVLMLGAGRMAKMTAKHLAALGARPILVFSRTLERAQELAGALGGQAVNAAQLPAALGSSDILVGCAAAPHFIIGRSQVEQAIAARQGRPLVVVDLAVPRNVDPGVGSLPGVHLFNLDDLDAVVAGNVEAREAEIERVRAIVAEEVARFERWQARTEAMAMIAQLRAKAEELRQECLRKATKHSGNGEAADYVTDLLVRKLLHRPIVALREMSCEEIVGADLASVVAKLFDLDGSSGPESSDTPDAEPETAAREH